MALLLNLWILSGLGAVESAMSPQQQYEEGMKLLQGDEVQQDIKAGVKLIKRAAYRDYPEAMHRMGVLHQKGLGLRKSDDRAADWWEQADGLGYVYSTFSLGVVFFEGLGRHEDDKQAERYFRKVLLQTRELASSDESELIVMQNLEGYCDYYLGLILYLRSEKEKDEDEVQRQREEALQHFIDAGRNDQVQALMMTAVMYALGQGTKQDADRANFYLEMVLGAIQNKTEQVLEDLQVELSDDLVKRLRSSSRESLWRIQEMLAAMMLNEDSEYYSPQHAALWYRFGIESGNVNAYQMMGYLCFKGIGVEEDREEAVRLWTEGAGKDNIFSKYYLGVCYDRGWVVEQDRAKAVELFDAGTKSALYVSYLGKKQSGVTDIVNAKEMSEICKQAAKDKDWDAVYCLGVSYQSGWYVDLDWAKAFSLYKQAAKRDQPAAQYKVGYFYYMGWFVWEDNRQALKWFEKSAELGNADATFKCAYILSNYHHGVKKDFARAREYYHRAIELDPEDTASLNNLALLYKNGEGGSEDRELALEYFERSMELGHALSARNAAFLVLQDRDSEADWKAAIPYFEKGAEGGDGPSLYQLGLCYQRGYTGEKDYIKGAEYFEKSAEEEYSWGFYELGKCLKSNLGVRQDFVLAMICFKKAWDKGVEVAGYELGEMWEEGMGYDPQPDVAEDFYKALVKMDNSYGTLGQARMLLKSDSERRMRKGWKLLEECLDKQMEDAQFLAGMAYYAGNYGVVRDFEKALEYFTLAAEQGHRVAQMNLGLMYVNGQGCEKDIEQGMKWIRKSAENQWGDACCFLAYSGLKGTIPDMEFEEVVKYLDAGVQNNSKRAVQLYEQLQPKIDKYFEEKEQERMEAERKKLEEIRARGGDDEDEAEGDDSDDGDEEDYSNLDVA